MRYACRCIGAAALLISLAGRSAAPVEASSGTAAGAAHFETDPDSKTLIVTTDAETNETIRKIIETLDRPVPQALIKVLFLEVTHGNDLDLGTDIRYENSKDNGDQTLIKTLFGAASFGEGGTIAVLENDLQVTLSALAEVSEMEVLSRPSIMARSTQEATITIGSEVPFIRNTQVTDDGRVLNTVEYEDIGIILTVTPFITEEGTVELDVAPEISTLTAESVQISENVQAPTFSKRSAQTRVVVPDGKTVVIGGLMDNQDNVSIKKIPVLGDIPGLGALFRRRRRDNTKTELLIFLTPHVVRNGMEAEAVTEAEKESTRLVPETFPDKDLRRYIPWRRGGTGTVSPRQEP